MTLTHLFHEYKVFNLIKIKESLDWFGTEMSSGTWIKTRNWRKPSASWRYVQLSDLYHYLQLTIPHSSHEYKVLNLIKVNEFLDWFGTEISSRPRIKTRNWRKPSASWRYVQLSDLYHYLQLTIPHSSHEYKVLNLIKVNESLDWFGTEMSSRNGINTRNWRKPSAL